MAMWSNAEGDLLHFQYYDASIDEVLDVSTTYEFSANDQLGHSARTHIFSIAVADRKSVV